MLVRNKEEKIAVLLLRVERIRMFTLLGYYKNYDVGEKKIRKLHNKILKLNGNPKARIIIEDGNEKSYS